MTSGERLIRHSSLVTELRLWDAGDQVINNGVGADIIGLGFEIEDEAMSQGGAGDRLDIGETDIVTAVEQGGDFGTEDECLRPTRAGAVTDVLLDLG